MMKKPMETGELFDRICTVLKEKNMMPDILDYSLASRNHIPITNEFVLRNDINYGGNEGIYLDLSIEIYNYDKKYTADIGTFKTLQTDREAMYTMTRLLADFMVELYDYAKENSDDFNWEGVDVYALDKNGESLKWRYTCSSMDRALTKRDEFLEKYDSVVVRDNKTRKEQIYSKK